jgi:uncharacterized protein (UPF0248 family)
MLHVNWYFPNIATGLQKAKSIGSIVRMWPQRLARQSSADDTVYEGSFVLGFSPTSQEADLQTVRMLANKLEEQVMEDRATIKGSCFIRVVFERQGDIEDLRPCATKCPRKTLTGDETPNSKHKRDGITPSKQKKKAEKGAVNDHTEHVADDHSEHEKAERFRTAAEVHNRLKFDDAWDIDEFVLGYIDRHNDKILEKPAVDWVRETTAEEFIPEHRIEYFKRVNADRGGEFMWHKSKRLDKIFKS